VYPPSLECEGAQNNKYIIDPSHIKMENKYKTYPTQNGQYQGDRENNEIISRR
jgi:hypothetical protein